MYLVLSLYPDVEIYQRDIEAELNIRNSSLSVLLKKMEAQNLIKRKTVDYDGRLKRILPTSQAIEMNRKIDVEMLSLEEKLITGIDKKNLNVFSDVLQKMKKNMIQIEAGGKNG